MDGDKHVALDMERDSGSDDSDTDPEDYKPKFINPLAKKVVQSKSKGEAAEEEDEWSDESDQDTKKGKKTTKVLGKRKRKGSADNVEDFFKNEVIEEVPANDPATREQAGYESADSDEVAELRVMAKKMLRKKDRHQIMHDSYNRYSFHEPQESLPSWFVEDESKHYVRHYNATKDEIAMEKEEIKAYNARPSKKVEEAKARKRKRLAKAMTKVRNKAQVIAD